MAKTKCIICGKVKGKRACLLYDDQLICPVCCAGIRSADCTGCRYYHISEQYYSEKKQVDRTKDYIVELNPEIEDAVNKALVLVEKGRYAEGEREIMRLYHLYPSYHAVLYAMGVIKLWKEELDRAIRYFNEAIEIFPDFVEAWYNKAAIHKEKLEIEEMIVSFRKVVELGDPKESFVRDADGFLRKMEKQILKTDGVTLDEYLQSKNIFDEAFKMMERKLWKKAVRGFEKVLKFSPNHVQSYGNLGICYSMLGKREKALQAYNKALELDPDYAPALANRQILLSLKEGELFPDLEMKAVKYYKERERREKKPFR